MGPRLPLNYNGLSLRFKTEAESALVIAVLGPSLAGGTNNIVLPDEEGPIDDVRIKSQ